MFPQFFKTFYMCMLRSSMQKNFGIFAIVRERPYHNGQKNSKNCGNMKFFLESCKETSKLPRDVFWSRWDHIVAQKSIFKIFFFENLQNSCNPPLLSYLRDLSWRVHEFSLFSKEKIFIFDL